jgi:hypothetical protein
MHVVIGKDTQYCEHIVNNFISNDNIFISLSFFQLIVVVHEINLRLTGEDDNCDIEQRQRVKFIRLVYMKVAVRKYN